MQPSGTAPQQTTNGKIRTRWRKVLARTAFWIGAFLLMFMLIRWFEYKQVYHPTTRLWATPAEAGLDYEDVSLGTGDGVKLHAWFVPSKESSDHADFVFLICHGNGGNLSHRIPLITLLHETGAAVLAFDYRGYGRSGGQPSESGTYLDAETAWNWLRDRGFEEGKVLLWGESLGGAVAAELALRKPCGGLVVQSAFTSIPDMGKELYPFLPVDWISTIHYDTRKKLVRVQVPVLILHSRADRIIPFSHAERNFEAANKPKILWEIAGDHNDQPLEAPELFREGVSKLFDLLREQKENGSNNGEETSAN